MPFRIQNLLNFLLKAPLSTIWAWRHHKHISTNHYLMNELQRCLQSSPWLCPGLLITRRGSLVESKPPSSNEDPPISKIHPFSKNAVTPKKNSNSFLANYSFLVDKRITPTRVIRKTVKKRWLWPSCRIQHAKGLLKTGLSLWLK